jgi:hypothetical protein
MGGYCGGVVVGGDLWMLTWHGVADFLVFVQYSSAFTLYHSSSVSIAVKFPSVVTSVTLFLTCSRFLEVPSASLGNTKLE